MSANLATLIAHPPMDGRDKPDTVQFALGFRHPASQRLHVALADGFIADDANLKWSRIPENAEIPVSFQISAGDAEALARQLVQLGFAADLMGRPTGILPPGSPCTVIHTAIVREVGRLTIAEPEPPHTRYEHAALITFENADALRDFLHARTVDVQLFTEPKP